MNPLEVGPPLPRAFAHNDNAQVSPLRAALALGFTAIEADVWLIDGELRVGHAREETDPGRTLGTVYLDPLAALLAEHGHVYDDRPLLLLIDVKTDARSTYLAVHAELAARPALLEHAVRVVISGNVDVAVMAAQPGRIATADAHVDRFWRIPSPVVGMVSSKWGPTLGWLPTLPLRRLALRTWVRGLSTLGRESRFWGTDATVWPLLADSPIDWIVADDLQALHDLLRARA